MMMTTTAVEAGTSSRPSRPTILPESLRTLRTEQQLGLLQTRSPLGAQAAPIGTAASSPEEDRTRPTIFSGYTGQGEFPVRPGAAQQERSRPAPLQSGFLRTDASLAQSGLQPPQTTPPSNLLQDARQVLGASSQQSSAVFTIPLSRGGSAAVASSAGATIVPPSRQTSAALATVGGASGAASAAAVSSGVVAGSGSLGTAAFGDRQREQLLTSGVGAQPSRPTRPTILPDSFVKPGTRTPSEAASEHTSPRTSRPTVLPSGFTGPGAGVQPPVTDASRASRPTVLPNNLTAPSQPPTPTAGEAAGGTAPAGGSAQALVGGEAATGAEEQRGHQAVELQDEGWFHAESNRKEQEMLASEHLAAIVTAVDLEYDAGRCPDRRWTNDPEVFPDLGLLGSITSSPVIPFPPHDQQYFVCGYFDRSVSKLREIAVPSHVLDEDGNSTWVRLVDFGDHPNACHVFDDTRPHIHHCGRVLQGSLDNGYLVEVLQAISLRPRLAKQLFYCYDRHRSVYVAKLFKHGTWNRIEIDDYVPVGAPSQDENGGGNQPICCRSEFFPHVLWPSLIEKAYAKLHTIRGSTTDVTDEDRGGWEAISDGGRVEEAFADLTGGVAGRFQTCDVSMDRLFLYIHELQRDTLFVCRPHQVNCELHGVRLNPYYPYVINRACVYEGRPYIQMFSGAIGLYDGGLQDIAVPYGLLHHEDYPETSAEGFFWCTAMDFHEYFDTIFECRLVNSGDVAIPNMPPPRIPPQIAAATASIRDDVQGLEAAPFLGSGPAGLQHQTVQGSQVPWFEWVYANPGSISRHNEPEFMVHIPDHAVPCEIIASVEQLDTRMAMTTPKRDPSAAILVKVYEHVLNNCYSVDMVCRSNWLPVRDSMVAFTAMRGGSFRLVAEFPDAQTAVDRMVFRCYASRPNVTVTAAAATMKHMLVQPQTPPKARKLTMVGCVRQDQLDEVDEPMPLNEEHDCMRKPEFDIDLGWQDLKEEFKQDCCVM